MDQETILNRKKIKKKKKKYFSNCQKSLLLSQLSWLLQMLGAKSHFRSRIRWALLFLPLWKLPIWKRLSQIFSKGEKLPFSKIESQRIDSRRIDQGRTDAHGFREWKNKRNSEERNRNSRKRFIFPKLWKMHKSLQARSTEILADIAICRGEPWEMQNLSRTRGNFKMRKVLEKLVELDFWSVYR